MGDPGHGGSTHLYVACNLAIRLLVLREECDSLPPPRHLVDFFGRAQITEKSMRLVARL